MTRQLDEIVSAGKLLLGVVHLRPLPGSPLFGGEPLERIVEAARTDAKTILGAGFDGYVIENFGDVPFHRSQVPPHIPALMVRIARDLPTNDAWIVVNVLRNDARSALAVAAAAGLDGIRVNVHSGAMVTDQGVIEGQAAETLRYRRDIAPHVAILADVGVKHASPLGSSFDIATAAKDTAYRGLADALIVTGSATGAEAGMDDLARVREAVPDRPLIIGSGTTERNVTRFLEKADGAIVGTWLKRDGQVRNPVDPARATRFVQAARK